MQPPLNPIAETERKVDDFYHFVVFGKKLSRELYYLPLKFEENDIAKMPVYMNGMKELFSSLPEGPHPFFSDLCFCNKKRRRKRLFLNADSLNVCL